MTRRMNKRPSFLAAMRLRCPYCGQTPLLEPGAWVVFSAGCPQCDYPYERETGYFTGAAWVITYTFAAFWGILVGGLLLWKRPEWGSLWIATLTSVVALVAAAVFMPFGKALWLWFDHLLHPLEKHETLKTRSHF